MIALLTGTLASRTPEQIILDVGGVGYRLQIPLSTFYALPETGQVQLHVHTHVKEDAIQLFGFLTPAEKGLFILLIRVSGVGPKLAVAILSHIPVEDLCLALSQGDIPRLTAIPGIGRKSAERLILELQEKAAQYGATIAGMPAPERAIGQIDVREDALSALINLGYKETQAKRALKSVSQSPGAPLEEILKAALKILQK